MPKQNVTDHTRRRFLKGIGGTAALLGLSGQAAATEKLTLDAGYHTLATGDEGLGPVTPRDTIYQLLTDRFYDGDASNNDFSDFDSSLYDGTGEDLKLYQGGDWQGIVDKIPYLVGMCITAV